MKNLIYKPLYRYFEAVLYIILKSFLIQIKEIISKYIKFRILVFRNVFKTNLKKLFNLNFSSDFPGFFRIPRFRDDPLDVKVFILNSNLINILNKKKSTLKGTKLPTEI